MKFAAITNAERVSEMKITYDVPFPTAAQKRMSPALEEFYKFMDSDNATAAFMFDTDAEATKAASNIAGAKYRRELNVECKKIGKTVYVRKGVV